TVLVNMIVCFVLALVILAPLIPYAVTTISILGIPLPLPTVDLYVALPISAVIALIVTYMFYKIALKNAKEFLIKAEV
ncbi:MAG: hypothetical protein OEW62_08955, partial [Candidatus Bathyarchaeota archaeon]|nr:hypothetical protein [Candidatus Bathyarchaeota archaeon]